MENADSLLVAAGLLAAAAYILTRDQFDSDVDAETASSTVSGSNGFAINNPGNIRYIASNPFRGQTGNHNGYGVYDTLADGVRAMGLQLSAYYARGLTTVSQIISTWAPSSENNTQAYIQHVCSLMGVSEDEPLSWPEDETSLIQAIAFHENGYNNMSDSFVNQAIAS